MATQTQPARTTTEREQTLSAQGLTPRGAVHWNLVTPQLVQHAIRRADESTFRLRETHHKSRMYYGV